MQQIKYTLLLLLFITSISTVAQNQAVVDSLEVLLETDLSDKERIDVWNTLAGQLATTDSIKVAEYTQKAIRLSKKINYPVGEARAYHSVAWIIMVKGDYEKAITFFKKEYGIAQKANDNMHKGRALLGLGAVANRQGNFEKAIDYYEKSLKEFEEIDAQRQMINAYTNIGIVKSSQGKYEEAKDYYFQALEIQIEPESKNEEKNANIYNNIGTSYNWQGNYQKSIEYYLKALKINEKIDKKYEIVANLNNIGVVYYAQNNYEKALEYYTKASQINEEIDYQWGLALNYVNISLVYGKLNNIEDALTFASKALKINQELGDKSQIVLDYVIITEIYIQSKEFQKALDYVEKALKLSQEIGAELETVKCHLNLGIIYYNLEEFTKAKEFLNKAIALASKIEVLQKLSEIYETLAKVEKELGNYEAAYEVQLKFKELSDSVFNEEKSKQIATLEIQYETEKKDQEILNLNQQAEIKDLQVQRRNFYLIGTGVLAVLLLGLGFVLFRQNQLKNEQQTTALEQRLLRSQMNPHFIFNSLIAIQNYIYQNKTPEAGRFLAKFSQLMRAILEGSRQDLISLEEEVKLLENYLTLQQLRFENRFTYEIVIDEKLNQEEVVIPPMLAQPFLESSIEHSFKNLEQEGKLFIRFISQDENLLLEMEDNGMGLNQSLAIKKEQRTKQVSRATQITQERLELFNKKESKKLSLNIRDRSEIEANTQGILVSLAIPLKFA